MKQQLKRVTHAAGKAATSHRTLTWTAVLNIIAAGLAIGASDWPVLRSHIPAHWWLVGAVVLAMLNALIHSTLARQAKAQAA